MRGLLIVIVAVALLFAFTLEAPAVTPRAEGDAAVAMWYPGKLLIQRRRSAMRNGGWYLGKNLGFGRRSGNSC